MSEASKAVFLSYASQDGVAAKRICDALRAAGVEVWFDQSELRGGDAWDQSIRKQIKECALFIPVVSANTQARREGYFRLEWKLADDRTHLMAKGTPFIVPVCVDSTKDWDAIVPDSFTMVQWTRLPEGELLPVGFAARVKQLLNGMTIEPPTARTPGWDRRPVASVEVPPTRRWFVPLILGLVVFAATVIWKFIRPAQAMPVAKNPSASIASPGAVDPNSSIDLTWSQARRMAERAKAMTSTKYNSTAEDFTNADFLLKQALALDENDPEILAIASEFNTSIRTRGYDDAPSRREAARSQAERAVRLAPDSINALYALARWQRDNDPDPTIAEKTFLVVLKKSPEHRGALFSLGTFYARQGRFDEAIAMFDRSAAFPDSLPLALYGEYLAYFSRWRFAEAERCLRQSIAAEPSSNSVCGLAMVLLTSKGDAPAAVLALEQVPLANRNEHRAVWMSAYAHLAAREPEAALSNLRRLSADFIQDNWFVGPTAYFAGRAQSLAGRPEAARIEFESGLAVIDARLKLFPRDAALHVARGELLGWLGRTDDALREAHTAEEQLRGHNRWPAWFISPVRIYAALGQADEAMPLLDKICRAPENAEVGWPLTPALLKIDPQWDKLRGDPRFEALVNGPAINHAVPLPPADGSADRPKL